MYIHLITSKIIQSFKKTLGQLFLKLLSSFQLYSDPLYQNPKKESIFILER